MGHVLPGGLRRVIPAPFETPGHAFAATWRAPAPGCAVRVLAPGESIDLPGPVTQETPPVRRGFAGSEEDAARAQPNATWATIPSTVRSITREEHRGEDADGVNLEVRGLRGHHASPFGSWLIAGRVSADDR